MVHNLHHFLFTAASNKQNTNIISCHKYLFQPLKQLFPWNSECILQLTNFFHSTIPRQVGWASVPGPDVSKQWVPGALPGWLAVSTPAQMALRFQEDQDKLAVKWQSHNSAKQRAQETSRSAKVMHSHASRGYPWPSHGLNLTSMSLATLCVWGIWHGGGRYFYCNKFWAVTQVWPQQKKLRQVSWVIQTEYSHKWILQQTLPAVFTHRPFTHFEVILTHHLHLYGSGEIIGSSVVLEGHNASVIPFIRTADNGNDKPGPLGVSLIEAIHRDAVLESGRKTLNLDPKVQILV